MRPKNLAIIILLVFTIAIGLLSATNAAPTSFSFFGTAIQLSSGWLLGIGYLAGILITAPLELAKIAQEKKADTRLSEWQVQDAKLAASVQTDREKQLEAKIATLEAALVRALKK